MDPFSVTAGVAGLLSLSIQVTQTTQKYVSSVKHAPKQAQELVNKLTALVAVLEQLERFIERKAPGGNFGESSVIYGAIKRCYEYLKHLGTTLSNFISATGSDSRLWRRVVKWPMTQSKHQQVVNGLHDYFVVFQLSISLDGWTLVSKTAEEAQAIGSSQSENISLVLRSVDALQGSIGGCRNELSSIKDTLFAKERSDILEWISNSVDPSQNYNQAIKQRNIVTGRWLTESNDFTHWIDTPGFLWLHGIPGSGKTVLCSTVIEIIQDVCKSFPDCRMAYFYFDFHDYEKQKMESLLRSLLRQLVAHEQNVPQPIVGLCKTLKDKGQSPSLKDLESALSLVLRQSLKDTYIVIDALDEFPDWTAFEKREELLRILTKIVVDHPSNLHVLASSRDEIDIRRAIEGIPHCEVCLGTFGIDIDIRSYVQTTLADPLERLSTFPDSLKSEIEMAVCQGAHGMFRWAFCQLEMLRNCRKARDIRESLKKLPATLDQTYEQILANVDQNSLPEALSILHWLVSSRRPLSLEELAEAAIIQPTDSSFDPDARLFDPNEALRICGSLVKCSIKEQTKETRSGAPSGDITTVRFAHYSVQEYLLSGRAGRFSIVVDASENHIACSCVLYLLHIRTEHDPSPALYPLVKYAAQFWFEHHNSVQRTQSSLSDLVYRLLSENFTTHSSKWLRFYDPWTALGDSYCYKSRLPFPQPPIDALFPGPLYYAVLHNLHDTARRLLEAGLPIDEVHGAEMTVQYISEILALNETDYWGNYTDEYVLGVYGESLLTARTSLHLAARKNSSEMLRLLLGFGADPNVHTVVQLPFPVPYAPALAVKIWNLRTFLLSRERFTTALGYAVSRGYVDAVEILLDHGADPNGRYMGCPSLIQAAHKGMADIVILLLHAGADVNARNLDGRIWYEQTALLSACSWLNVGMVRILIDAGADLHAAENDRTALQAAVAQGSIDIIRCLLEAGADVNLVGQDSCRMTPVPEAVRRGDRHIVLLLLKHSADINLALHSEENLPICIAARQGDCDIAELLLQSAANVNPRLCPNVATPLFYASRWENWEVVWMLLESGADVDIFADSHSASIQTKSYAVLAASVGTHTNFSQLLTASKANIYPPRSMYSRAIKKAAPTRRCNTMQTPDNTAACIRRATRDMHWAVLDTLRKADRSNYGRSQLPSLVFCAASVGHYDLVKLLLDAGADPRCPFGKKSPLRVARDKGYNEIAHLLRKYYTELYTTSTAAYTDIMNRMKQRKLTCGR